MTTMTKTSLWHRVSRLTLTLGALFASGMALAVNDLPGGPAVRQLNLHPPVTRIAEQQAWLHWFMLIVCVVIFVGVFGVMFYSCLLYTSPSPRDRTRSRMPSSA